MRFDLPAKAKPSKAVSKAKQLRPHLERAYIEERDGKVVLIATDSYKLLELPITAEDVEPTYISLDALKAIERTGRGEVGEYVEPLDKQGNANGVLFRKPVGTERPKWADLEWPKKPTAKNKLVIGLNAELLHELAQAMAAHHGQVKLTIDLSKTLDGKGEQRYEKPIVVEPLAGSDGRGMLMPVRVTR